MKFKLSQKFYQSIRKFWSSEYQIFRLFGILAGLTLVFVFLMRTVQHTPARNISIESGAVIEIPMIKIGP